MRKSTNFKTSYSKMYLVPEEIYNKLLTCIDPGEQTELYDMNEKSDQNVTENQHLDVVEPDNSSQTSSNEINSTLQTTDNVQTVQDPSQNSNTTNENLQQQTNENTPLASLSPSLSEPNEPPKTPIECSTPNNTTPPKSQDDSHFPIWTDEKQKKIIHLQNALKKCESELAIAKTSPNVRINNKGIAIPIPTKRKHGEVLQAPTPQKPRAILVPDPSTTNTNRRSKRVPIPKKEFSEFDNWEMNMDKSMSEDEFMDHEPNARRKNVSWNIRKKLKNKRQKNFSCPTCFEKFSTKLNQRKHIVQEHTVPRK